jgi:hypothetical protein
MIDKELESHLVTIRRGGDAAVKLFLKIVRKLHKSGDQEFMRHWVGVALAALPARDRTSALTLLLQFLGENGAFVNTHEEHQTLQ